MSEFKPGDPVIYKMTKQSSHPTLRASTVNPSNHGDNYNYVVDKFWVVKDVLQDGQIVVQTRRGKTRSVSQDDPSLKRPSLWHRWFYRNRFPQIDDMELQSAS